MTHTGSVPGGSAAGRRAQRGWSCLSRIKPLNVLELCSPRPQREPGVSCDANIAKSQQLATPMFFTLLFRRKHSQGVSECFGDTLRGGKLRFSLGI